MLYKTSILFGLVLLLGLVSAQTSNVAVNAAAFQAAQGPFLSSIHASAFLPQSRESGVTWCAIHDAVNTVDQQYNYCHGPIVSDLRRQEIRKANLEAVIVGAFYTAYANHTQERTKHDSSAKLLSPQQQADMLASLASWRDNQLAEIRSKRGVSSRSVEDGLAFGEAAAKQHLDITWDDGWRDFVPLPVRQSGIAMQWSLAGYPSFATEFYPWWLNRRPFLYRSQEEFQVPGPAHPNSTTFLRDVEEVKSYGVNGDGTPGSRRTADSIAKAQWWQGGGLEHTNVVLQKVAIIEGFSLHKTVQAYAACGIAYDHAMVNNLWNKERQNFWRPFQYIRNTYNLDYDLYPGLKALADPGWRTNVGYPGSGPAGFTPTTQEYPCGHCQLTTAGSQAVANVLGFDVFPSGPVTVNYEATPARVPQTFDSWTDVQNQVTNGRIYVGVHLRDSAIAGTALGRGIGGLAAARLRPIDSN